MKRRSKIRILIATAVLILAAVGGWIARRRIERYAADKLMLELVLMNDADGVAWAARAGADVNEKAVTEWMHKEAEENLVDYFGDREGLSLLHLAAYRNYAETVRVLLAAGADADAQAEGETVLCIAASRNCAPVVDLLLDAGADVNMKNYMELTALHCAAISGHDGMVRRLCSKGAVVNPRNYEGRTPLGSAIIRGHKKTVGALIAAGADVNEQFSKGSKGYDGDVKGWAVLHAAASGNWRNDFPADMTRMLLVAGAHPDRKDQQGRTPLHQAAFRGRPGAVRELLKGGADPDAKGKNGWSPLEYAVREEECPDIVIVLAEAGANVKSKFSNGDDPLLAATYRFGTKVGTAMVEAGANVNALEDGKTLLDWVEDAGFKALLRKHGAKTGKELKAEGKTQ